MNNQFCWTLAKSKEEIHDKTDYDFYPKELADEYVLDDQKVIKGETLEKTERHYSSALNRFLRVRVVKTPVRDAENKIVGVQAIFWDVTAEEEIQERYRELVRQSPDSIIVQDNQRITLANPAAVCLFGVASEELLIGRSIIDFVDPEYVPMARDWFEKLISNQAVEQKIEMRVLRDAEKFDVAVYARPLPGNAEIQVVLRNLEPYNLMLRDMQHRVRKSLNEVSRYLGLQRRNAELPEVDRAFRAMEDRIQAMSLVHEIIHAQFGKSEVPVEGYLKRLVGAVFASHGREDSAVVWEVSAPDIQLDGDTAKDCGIVVAELVSNSLLYAFPDGQSGKISICLGRDGNELVLTAIDNGRGFPDAPHQKHRSMGMSVIKGVVDLRLNGTFKFKSEKENGVEAVIRFKFPTNGTTP